MKNSRSEDTYKPVSCSLYDELELAIMRKTQIEIVYMEEDEEITVEATPIDIYSREGAEFIVFDDGLELRLDKVNLL
jgi:Rho-binding antiterminator